jgi:hypothetical protein
MVAYHDGTSGEKMDFEIESTIEGVTYEKTGACGPGEFNSMQLGGTIRVTGDHGGGAVDVTQDPEWGFIYEKKPSRETYLKDGKAGLKWKFDAFQLECEEESGEGESEVEETEEGQEVTVTSSGCSAEEVPVKMDYNGCNFVDDPGTKVGKNFEATTDITCPAKSKIEFTDKNCLITVPAQTGLAKVTWINNGKKGADSEVTIEFDISGLTYDEDAGAVCKNAADKKNGTLTGFTTWTAENPANPKEMIGVEVG